MFASRGVIGKILECCELERRSSNSRGLVVSSYATTRQSNSGSSTILKQSMQLMKKQQGLLLQLLQVGNLILLCNSKNQHSHARKIKIDDNWVGPYRIRENPEHSTFYLLEELGGTHLKKTIAGNCLKKFFMRRELDEVRSKQHVVIRV